MRRVPALIAGVAGVVLLVAGLWAFFDPRSFYDQLAPFPPYHEHFLHDVGSFQVGLGAALLLALRIRDALLLALTGVGIGSAFHFVSHVIDRDLGGRPSDPVLLGILAAALLAGALLRARQLRRV